MLNGFVLSSNDLLQKIAPKLTKLLESFGCKYVLIVVPVSQIGQKGASMATNMTIPEAESILKDIEKGLKSQRAISPLSSLAQ